MHGKQVFVEERKPQNEVVDERVWLRDRMETELERLWGFVYNMVSTHRQPSLCWCGAWVWPENVMAYPPSCGTFPREELKGTAG